MGTDLFDYCLLSINTIVKPMQHFPLLCWRANYEGNLLGVGGILWKSNGHKGS